MQNCSTVQIWSDQSQITFFKIQRIFKNIIFSSSPCYCEIFANIRLKLYDCSQRISPRSRRRTTTDRTGCCLTSIFHGRHCSLKLDGGVIHYNCEVGRGRTPHLYIPLHSAGMGGRIRSQDITWPELAGH